MFVGGIYVSTNSKRKEDSLVTRNQLIDSAFENFYDIGFENASLEKISKDAHVSRGAAYWHFKNKHELFAETVRAALGEVTDIKQAIYDDPDLTVMEKLVKVLACPYRDIKLYRFMQSAAKTIEKTPEFADLLEELAAAKGSLFDFFLRSVTEIKASGKVTGIGDPHQLASLLYTYFEGMHVSVIPQELRHLYGEAVIRENLAFLFRS